MRIGESATVSRTVTNSDVRAFANLTGDRNPIHLDDAYAAQTRFGRRIAHGMLLGGWISSLLATRLPGPGSTYLSQTMKFHAPVYIGDTVTVTVTALRADKPIVTLATVCRNEHGVNVADGEAVVLLDRPGARP